MPKKRLLLLLIILCGIGLGLEFFGVPPPTTADTHAAAAYLAQHDLATPPHAFTHDGCTLFTDRLPYHDFRPGCLAHDIAYWAGGDSALKDEADITLKNAITESGPLGFLVAPFVYSAVQYLGDSPLTRLRNANWGYGWNE